MNPILRNVLAVIAGVIIGGVVNMGIIILSPSVIPPPEGVDPSDMESLMSNMHLFEAKHFIMPFLAHAIGTLAGAYTSVRIGVSQHLKLALIVGAFFAIGGIMMVMDLPSPPWFEALDIIVAYFPMAWLGWKLAGGNSEVKGAD